MFWNKKEDKTKEENAHLKSEKTRLEKEIDKLKQTCAELKLEKKMSEEDIKHMVKIRMETLDLEHKKKEMEVLSESEKKLATIKDEYRDKIEKRLEKEAEGIKTMYAQILERLPNVNVALGREFGTDGNTKT